MKIAVLSESPADEAAILTLAQGLLSRNVQIVPIPFRRLGGWQAALKIVRAAMLHLHYETNVDGFIAVVDSDDTPVHRPEHDQTGGPVEKCRLCRLRSAVYQVQSRLQPRQGRGPIKTALGLAVPTIEAWYLVGVNNHVTESAWMTGLDSRRPPFTRRSLKQEVYGAEEPTLVVETECAMRHARRILESEKLELLERLFPNGFGALARGLRDW
jgi:hypothetical protein